MNAPTAWIISAMLSCCWPLLQKAIHCSFLLHAVTEAVSMKMAPLKCTCPFLQADFPRVGKREWNFCAGSLQELIHLQSRHWGPPSHLHPWCESIRSFRQSILRSNKFPYGTKRLGSVAQMPVHTDSIWPRAAEWAGGGPVVLTSLLSQWKEMG